MGSVIRTFVAARVRLLRAAAAWIADGAACAAAPPPPAPAAIPVRAARTRRPGRFGRDDSGSATIEYVLWLPLFFTAFALTFDVSMAFHSMSRMWDVARETARLAAVGQMGPAEAAAYAETRLPANATYTVDVSDSDGANIIVTIVDQGDYGIFFGAGRELVKGSTAVYTMRKEF